MKATLVLFTILLASQVHGNLLEGLEHHGEHGHHGDHGDHHGEHHGEHGEHDTQGEHGDHAHGDAHNHAHGDEHNHAHGDSHNHAHGDEHSHNHGDEHNHNHESAAANQDPFATALSSELGGGFLSSLPANPAPAETFVAPAPVPAETFVAPAPASAPRPVEFVAPVQEQQFPSQNQNAIQFPEKDRSSDQSSSGEPKQLAAVDVSGRAGAGDFPEYAVVPPTSFSCAAQETGGYFADPEAQCQVFHICLNGQNLGSFLCPNGTLFHQQYFVCDWWFNVDCGVASQSYGLNARIGVVPESE